MASCAGLEVGLPALDRAFGWLGYARLEPSLGAGARMTLTDSKTPTLRFAIPVVTSAVLAIVAHYQQWLLLHWICKPLTTVLILAMVWLRSAADSHYRRWLAIGLLWSLAGDVFLMLPSDRFIAGLLCFLVAHAAYLVAFSGRARPFARRWPFVGYAVIAGAVIAVLWPGIPPGVRVPVLVYVLALGAMAAQAATTWAVLRDRASACAAFGGGLFLLSDSLIAWNRFGDEFSAARLLILSSYWSAQWLLALSLPVRQDRSAEGTSAIVATARKRDEPRSA